MGLSALLIGLALALAGASAAAASRYRARVAGLSTIEGEATARHLRALPEEERPRALARRAPPGSFEHRLAEALLAAEGDAVRVEAVNELLGEAAHRLDVGAGWPAAATRIAALGALLLAAAAYLAGAAPGVVAAVLGVGLTGAIAAAAQGRAARAEAARARRSLDALVAAAVGRLAEDPVGAPPRRGRRGRR